MIRDALLDDVSRLSELETRCFESDRLSPQSFRRFIAKTQATVLVDTDAKGGIRGYALVLYRRGSSLARLYSIAVDPRQRGKGIAHALLAEAEARALQHGATRMRLEVHQDNARAQALYREHGYRAFAVRPDYYEDRASAVRMEKQSLRKVRS